MQRLGLNVGLRKKEKTNKKRVEQEDAVAPKT